MQLTVEQVKNAYLITAGIRLSPDEAKASASLLGSREELLAALVLRLGVLAPWPELSVKLREIAHDSFVAPTSPRKEIEDRVLFDQHRIATAKAIEQLILKDQERVSAADEVHSALVQQVLSWNDAASHPGYQYVVAHEPR